MTYLIYSDGGCLNNGKDNAQMYGSFAVYNLVDKGLPRGPNIQFHDEVKKMKPMVHESKFKIMAVMEERPTNNLAEVRTLQRAITWLKQKKLFKRGNKFVFCLDSELTVRQFKGIYRIRNSGIKRAQEAISTLLEGISKGLGYDVRADMSFYCIPEEIMKKTIIAH